MASQEPPGKAPCPGPTFSWPREPEGILSNVFPVGAHDAQIGVGGCLCGHLKEKPEIELPLHLPWSCSPPVPGGARRPWPPVNLRRGSDCSLLGPAGLLGPLFFREGLGEGSRMLKVTATPEAGLAAGRGGDPPLLSQAGQLGPSWAACLRGEAGGGQSRQVPSVIASGLLKGIV